MTVRLLVLLIIVTNALWLALASWQQAKYAAAIREGERLYYANEANDHAATECAQKTGWRYNCADGSQKVSCGE